MTTEADTNHSGDDHRMLARLAETSEAEGETSMSANAPTSADAALIALCATMPAVLRDLNATPGDLNDDAPEWLPYGRVADAMCKARPETMAGVLAMARATIAHADQGGSGGADDRDPDGVVAVWALAIVRHLLRIEGEA